MTTTLESKTLTKFHLMLKDAEFIKTEPFIDYKGIRYMLGRCSTEELALYYEAKDSNGFFPKDVPLCDVNFYYAEGNEKKVKTLVNMFWKKYVEWYYEAICSVEL